MAIAGISKSGMTGPESEKATKANRLFYYPKQVSLPRVLTLLEQSKNTVNTYITNG